MFIHHAIRVISSARNHVFSHQLFTGLFSALLSLGVVHSAYSAPAQAPLFQANPVKPIMMLNMSKDHQLYFKIYDDYADITDSNRLLPSGSNNPNYGGAIPDGIPDTTYVHKYEYYGYFDSAKCYIYSTARQRFEPTVATDSMHYCVAGNNHWSGNFLNWSTMTRMDAVRKILYGGLRSTDATAVAGDTVLERALLPFDAHAFAKFYDGADINKLTPFSVPSLTGTTATGITLCNATPAGSLLSQNVNTATYPPLIRVAKGNYTLWASNERWQCKWRTEMATATQGVNGNNVVASGINAYGDSPVNANKLSVTGLAAAGDYVARVKVCQAGMLEANCTSYPSGNNKPTGLLQEFGQAPTGTAEKIQFGLMTGTYSKNKSGGVLRKTIGNINNEINVNTDGTFTSVSGVIKTLNLLKIYGYKYSDGTYHNDVNAIDASGSDGCKWTFSVFGNGHCTNWGNPQAEIYLESLRYLAGQTVSDAFNADDSSKIAGLTTAAWGSNPVTNTNYCAPLNVLQFNASTTSYDGDELGGASDILNGNSLNTWTNSLANTSHENFTGDFFIGENGTDNNALCTPKSIINLSSLYGTCPDAPRLKGSYQIAGLAYYARQNDIMPGLQGTQSVRTFGVSLSPAVPKVTIPVPGRTQSITILPACRNTSPNPAANCAIVDFKFVQQTSNGATSSGKLYVNWEDTEQGGDYDQDMWGVINYAITNSTVTITTDTIAQSTGDRMGFGYVINGTTTDGFYVHSGVNGFTFGDCNNCTNGNAATVKTYAVGTSSAKLLPTPLSLAAKWGGYSTAFEKEAVQAAADANVTYDNAYLDSKVRLRDSSDSYYFATDPRALETSLRTAFNNIASGIGSATAVATVSARVSADSLVFQAQFNSEDWSGALYGYGFNNTGGVESTPELCSKTVLDTNNAPVCVGTMQTTSAGRQIYSNRNGSLVNLSWDNLTAPQKLALRLTGENDDVKAIKRVNWLAGDATNEMDSSTPADRLFRKRGAGSERNILGDIVNSGPVYLAGYDYEYHGLPALNGGSTYRTHLDAKRSKTPMIFVGANDGMLHVFDATTLREKFAYIPSMVFPKLASLTEPSYTTTANAHKYIVDGSIAVGDVYTGGSWHSIVVGSLGAGGKGIYALDVTDIDNPYLLFEYTHADLGFVLGKLFIVPTPDNRWAVVFGNGDSSGTTSKLFMVDIVAPESTNTKIINTEVGTSGLSSPAVLLDAAGRITSVYAGDLNGNIWRFIYPRVTTVPIPSPDWSSYKVFAAQTGQPITAAPTIGYNDILEKNMVYVGTGSYYTTTDGAVGTNKQSFYAVADMGEGNAPLLTDLLQKTMLTDSFTAGSEARTVSTANPVWQEDKGWYLDLHFTPSIRDERVTTKALLIQDKVIITTLIPSPDLCKPGGSSWLMEIPAIGDKYIGQHILQPNTSIYSGELFLGEQGVAVFGFTERDPSNSNGSGNGSGGGSNGADCAKMDAALLNAGTKTGISSKKIGPKACMLGRQSWRQLR